MVKWFKVIETEHGFLLRSLAGSTKAVIHCNNCGCLIISRSAPKNSWRQMFHYRWVKEGNQYAVCNKCDSRSAFTEYKEV